MLRDVVWSDDGMYKVGDVYNPERFFSDALNNSSEFDLQLGYFSSATISVLATAFASFISKGGKIRLVVTIQNWRIDYHVSFPYLRAKLKT